MDRVSACLSRDRKQDRCHSSIVAAWFVGILGVVEVAPSGGNEAGAEHAGEI